MVKKVQKSAEPKFDLPAGLLDNPLAQSVKESAQQIWLAGMGAFAKAQEGRQKVFEALIKEGTQLQRRSQSAAEEKIGEVTDRMSAMAGDVTAKDVDALIKRVDELAAAVERLSKSAPAKAAKPPAKPAAKAAARPTAKPAAKTAAKTAAKKTVRRSTARKTSR